jgi:hypothetical protein
MPKKKPTKAKSPKKSKSKNLVLYVEGCTMKGKTFKDASSMNVFIHEFNEKYDQTVECRDDWIELVVTGINGNVTPMDEALEIT